MRHHRPCRRSCLQPLAASFGQGGGNSSVSLGEGGGGVEPPRNEAHDAVMYQIMQLTRQESRWTEERMETQLKELKADQKSQYKDIKAGQEKMREGLEKKMEAGQERMEALFRDLITGQEKMREGLEKKMEAQAQDIKAGQEKMGEGLEKRMEKSEKSLQVIIYYGIAASAFSLAQQGGVFSSLWAFIKSLPP